MKKITLECYTNNAGIYEFFPISPAKKYIPEWFKNIPATIQGAWHDEKLNTFRLERDIPTFKHCDGFNNLYNKGWVLPLWSDLILETSKDGKWWYQFSDDSGMDSDQKSTIQSHSAPQLGNAFEDHIQIKIMVPWHIKEKTGINFLFSENTWGITKHFDDMTILPGVLNFKHQNGAHINIFLKKKDAKFTIEHNTPLIYCVPLGDVKLEIKNHLVTDQELKHLEQLSYQFSFLGTYKKRSKLE